MKGNVFYLLNENVLFYPDKGRLININSKLYNNALKCILMRVTMTRLLIFLIENRYNDIISNDDILYNVWDKFNLHSSTQRLNQVMNSLKTRLIISGVDVELIIRFNRRSYKMVSDYIVPVYPFENQNPLKR